MDFLQGFGSKGTSSNNTNGSSSNNNNKPHQGDSTKLAQLTFLTARAAKECFERNNKDLYTSLASFVQSQSKIPDSYFSTPDKQARKSTGKEVNNMLRTAYEIVEKVIENTRVEVDVAWKACALAEWNQKKAIEEASKLASSKSNTNNNNNSSSSTSNSSTTNTNNTTSGIKNIYAQKQADHDTRSFFEMPGFFEKEVLAGCTLVNMNKGFLEKNRDVLRARLLKWVEKTGPFHAGPLPFSAITNPDENTVRVIILDAVRTFLDDAHRKKLTEFLFMFSQELQSYGQAMCYLASVCLLVLNEEETTKVLRMVGKDYIRGHWAAEARGFATNAWLIEHFMQKKVPDVAKHLMSMNWWPDMYMQKILSGLCIHVLPWDQMFQFLDKFMEKGFSYLVQFMLALVEHFGPRLLKLTSPNQANSAFELLKLDHNLVEYADVTAIFKKADENESWVQAELAKTDLGVLRSEIFDTKLAKRLDQSKGEEFEPCDNCDKEKPIFWCDECDEKICAGCKGKKHSSHKVEDY